MSFERPLSFQDRDVIALEKAGSTRQRWRSEEEELTMSQRFIALAAALLLSTSAQLAAAEPVKIALYTPYAADAKIATNVLNECTQLGAKLSNFLKQFAGKRKIEVVQVTELDTSAAGLVLDVQIDDAVSAGNAFSGHAKFMQATGVLYRDGERIGETTYTRNSMGGMFGGYKGSCAVLGRNSKALGKDFATFLKQQGVGG